MSPQGRDAGNILGHFDRISVKSVGGGARQAHRPGSEMVDQIATRIMQHRLPAMLSVLALVALCGYGAQFLRTTVDYRVYFGPDNPQLQAFNALQEQYSKDDNILVAIAPAGGDVFAPRMLDLVEQFTAAAWHTPHSQRVDSLTNFPYSHAQQDDLIVEYLFENALEMSAEQIARRKHAAYLEPVLLHALLSGDGAVTGVNITINMPQKNQAREVFEAVGHVRALVADYSARYPDVAFYLVGQTMLNNAFPEITQKDSRSLYPAMFLLILVLLGLFLRNAWAVFGTLLVVVLASLAGAGVIGYTGIRLAPIAVGAPMMIMTLAVADCVHLLVSYFQALPRLGSRAAAMQESLCYNLQPIFLTTITTAVGFLSLNFSDSPPFHVMGNMVAVGVLVAFLLTVLLLAPLMTFLPVGSRSGNSLNAAVMTRFGQWVVRHRRVLFIANLAVAALLVAMIPLNEFDDSPTAQFDERTEFRSHVEFVNQRLTGVSYLNYSLYSGAENGVADPAYLETLEQFANWLRSQPRVRHVSSFTDVMKRLNRNMHGDDLAWYRLPGNRELAAQYLLLYEMSLPFGLDLTNQVSFDRAYTKVSVNLDKSSAREIIAMDRLAQEWLRDNAPVSMWTEGASANLMFAHISRRNTVSMLGGLLAALVIISAILLLALRSVRLGVVSLVPNLLPLGMAFGAWALLSGQVGLGISVTMGMTIGIVVDDTVHFLTKYLRARREKGLNSEQAVVYAFETVGMALVGTTLVLSLGFSVLMGSLFRVNADLGAMSAMTILLAFLVDFLFLPPLLMMMEESNVQKTDPVAAA